MGTSSEGDPFAWYEVPIYFHRPGKELYRFSIRLVDRPGAVTAVTNVVRSESINVLHLSGSAVSSRGYGILHMFAEGPKLSADHLTEKLRAIDVVQEVRVESGEDGLLVGTALPVRSIESGERVLSLTSTYFFNMLDAIRDRMGTGGSVLIYEQGSNLGRAAFAGYFGKVGVEWGRQHLEYAFRVWAAVGWGRVRSATIDPSGRSMRLRLEDGLECAGRQAYAPYSQFYRGYLAGAGTVILGGEVTCTERKCLAMGDPACEFEIVRSR